MRIVFDIDGTLADASHRLHYIQSYPKNWDAFFWACVDDTPITPVVLLARTLLRDGYHNVAFWTGRDDMVEHPTRRWLAHHLGYSADREELRMRSHGDHRPDYEIKEGWLREWKPDLVFEDRQAVVDMYRRHGIRVCQVAPGNY